jgi:hypothetical protein
MGLGLSRLSFKCGERESNLLCTARTSHISAKGLLPEAGDLCTSGCELTM